MTFNEFIDAAVKAAKEMDHAHAMSEIMHIKCDDPLAKEILKRYERINHLIYFITGIRCGYEQFKASMSYGQDLVSRHLNSFSLRPEHRTERKSRNGGNDTEVKSTNAE